MNGTCEASELHHAHLLGLRRASPLLPRHPAPPRPKSGDARRSPKPTAIQILFPSGAHPQATENQRIGISHFHLAAELSISLSSGIDPRIFYRTMQGFFPIRTFGPILIFFVAAATGLYASFLPLAPDVVTQGAWSYSQRTDPIAHTRLPLIFTGLINPILGTLFAIGLNPRDKRNSLQFALVFASAAACFSFGWRNTPYWANGVYQTHLGRFSYFDMDPKALPPMTWIGESWRLSVLVFPLFLFIFTVAVFVLIRWAWRNERGRVQPLITILMIGFAWLPFFWRVKSYTSWLLD